MKNEKFCFSKGTGLIALVGIFLIVAVFAMNTVTSEKQTTGAKASFGCPEKLTYPLSMTDYNKGKCNYPMTDTNGALYKFITPEKTFGGILPSIPEHESMCCYVARTFKGGLCPAHSSPRPFCIPEISFPGGLKVYSGTETGVSVRNDKLGIDWPCCKIINPLNSGTGGSIPTMPAPTVAPTAVVPTSVPPTACIPDGNLFSPKTLGCEICKSQQKNGYFASSNAQGKYQCYILAALPKPNSAGQCRSSLCVQCDNKPVENSLCRGVATQCPAKDIKTTLAKIVTDGAAGQSDKVKSEKVKSLMRTVFLASTTSIGPAADKNLSSCYLKNGAFYVYGAKNGAGVNAASYAGQPVGSCVNSQLDLRFQAICTCASMRGAIAGSTICEDAMTLVGELSNL